MCATRAFGLGASHVRRKYAVRVDLAFDSWIVPLLGLVFLPWTTLMYVIVWSPVGGVEGAEWILVALGLALDIASYSARAARRRTSYS